MSYNRYNRNRRSTGGSRWMALRYAGICKVCGTRIPAGTTAFYDSAAKTVTCHNMECADADGLTTMTRPTGPWDGPARPTFSDHRIGSAAPIPARSGEYNRAYSRGRCEDAPCCGCCD